MSFIRNFNATRLAVTLLIILCAVGGVAYYMYQRDVLAPEQRSQEALRIRLLMMMKTLAEETPQHLDARFSDPGGTGVAQAPEAGKCIDPEKLTFSYVGDPEADRYAKVFAPLMAYITSVTGKPCEYEVLKSSDDEVAALSGGKLTIAAFSTGAVPLAVNKAGFVPVCRIPPPGGASQMEILVPADSPIRTPGDLKGHELTFTDASSNSGCKAAIVLLKDQFGLEPGTDYQIRMSGGQDASLTGLVKGPGERYEAVAVASDMQARLVARGDLKPAQYRVIYTSPDFPTACLGYAYNLRPELAKKVAGALLSYNWNGTPMAIEFAPAKETKFVPVDYRKDWSSINDVDNEIVKMGQAAQASGG